MTKLIVFKSTGEVRRAKPGERYLRWGVYEWNTDERETEYPYPIYTRHEIEATPEVLAVLKLEVSK